jgi:hypothetical protein
VTSIILSNLQQRLKVNPKVSSRCKPAVAGATAFTGGSPLGPKPVFLFMNDLMPASSRRLSLPQPMTRFLAARAP